MFKNFVLIASAKSQSLRGASHQPALMGCCSYWTKPDYWCSYLFCLTSVRTLLFWSDVLVVGRVVSLEKCKSSGLGRSERWEDSKVARSEG